MARTTPVTDFDAELSAFLDWRADQVAGAPSTAEVTRRISGRVGVGRRPRPAFARTGLVLVALALSLALVAAAAWVASRPPAVVTTTIGPTESPTAAPTQSGRAQPPELAGSVTVAVKAGIDAINPVTGRT